MTDNNRNWNNRDDQYFDANRYGSAGAYNTSYDSRSSVNEIPRSNEMRTGGGHKGKGPKGYHRSEERIREDAYERLTYDDRVDASNIDIQVQGEDLILTGTVNSKEEKWRAEDIVENISGIRNVENRIRIGRSNEPSSRSSMSNATSSDADAAMGSAIPTSTSATFGNNMTTSTSISQTTGSRRGRNKQA